MAGTNQADNEIRTGEVFRTSDRYEFLHVCNALTCAGLPFIVQDEALGSLLPVTVDGLAVKRIFVKTTDLVRADKIIREFRQDR